jgi:hypothetical protein
VPSLPAAASTVELQLAFLTNPLTPRHVNKSRVSDLTLSSRQSLLGIECSERGTIKFTRYRGARFASETLASHSQSIYPPKVRVSRRSPSSRFKSSLCLAYGTGKTSMRERKRSARDHCCCSHRYLRETGAKGDTFDPPFRSRTRAPNYAEITDSVVVAVCPVANRFGRRARKALVTRT